MTSASAPAVVDSAQDSDDVFLQPSEMKAEAKSPVPGSGRETPLDMERVKPATPDFSQITAAQVGIFFKNEF